MFFVNLDSKPDFFRSLFSPYPQIGSTDLQIGCPEGLQTFRGLNGRA